MIDDSPHGVAAARAAGMISIGFVDPSDPRGGRRELLSEAGALSVAMGAEEIPAALIAAGERIAGRSGIRQGQG